MSTRQRKPAEPLAHEPNWTALDALSDDDIAAQIAVNPDAAPDVSAWPLERAKLMEPIDVRAIRDKLGMPQQKFADTFGITVGALRDWEQQRRIPRGPARALLQIIDREPAAARRALEVASRRRSRG